MIISKQVEAYSIELEQILTQAVKSIKQKAIQNRRLLDLSGIAFEKEVCKALNESATQTDFANTFEQASRHAFPDLFVRILEEQWFGVEVKTSQKDWKCFGNSIFETTRVKNLEDRIYVFFGKFTDPLKCRWAKYEQCIDNINITHSPRYQINMDVISDPKTSVFAKMNISYYDFYLLDVETKMDYIRQYKKATVGRDVALWWLPTHDEPSDQDEQKLSIQLFSSLSIQQKVEIRYKAIALFPAIFSRESKKYDAVLVWLASNYGVVTGSIRDLFSAGGKYEVEFEHTKIRIPKIFSHVVSGISTIKDNINKHSTVELSDYWNTAVSENNKLEQWIGLVVKYADLSTFPLAAWLTHLYSKSDQQ